MKKCPFCAEEIQEEAIKCRHCGEALVSGAIHTEKINEKEQTSVLTDISKKWWFWVIVIILVLGFIGSQSKTSNDSSVSSSSPSAATPKVYRQGETAHVGYTSYAVSSSQWSSNLSDNPYLDQKPDAMFLVVNLSVRNDDKEPRAIPAFKLIDENGATYEVSSKAWSVKDSIGVLESLNPSVQKNGVIVFDVPQGHSYKLMVSGGYWSSDSTLIELLPK